MFPPNEAYYGTNLGTLKRVLFERKPKVKIPLLSDKPTFDKGSDHERKFFVPPGANDLILNKFFAKGQTVSCILV